MSGFSGDTFKSILGGGIPGRQPVGGFIQDTVFNNDRGINRSVLRKSFGNMFNTGLDSSPLQIATKGDSLCGSFRAATMAGDVIGSINSATNIKYGVEHNNIVKQYSSLNLNNGSIRRNGSSSYSGDPKYVYDNSDFLRYKKLKSINQTYNDMTLGGDQNNGSKAAKTRIKM